jgi:RND family efflux transporter MFP subunit
MNRKNIIIAGTVCTLVIGAFGVSALQTDANEIEVSHAKKRLETIVTEKQNWPVTINYTGFVRAEESKNYAFMTSGRLEEIYIKKGDSIKKGDLLATVDIDYIEFPDKQNIHAMEQSIDAAKTGLSTLKTQLESARILYEQGGVSKVSLDTLEAEYESRQAALETLKSKYAIQKNQANKNTKDGFLIADSDGYAINVLLKKGEIVGPGLPVVVSKSREKVIQIGVNIDDYSNISYETSVWINGDIPGRITRIGAYPDEYSLTYPVDISFDNDLLSMGEIVDVEMDVASSAYVNVPINSVVNIEGLDYVYKVDNEGNVSRHEVTLGMIKGKDVQLLNMDHGQRIVTEGVKYLRAKDQILFWEESEDAL